MYLYHVSPITNRESIREYGLRGNEGDPLWDRTREEDYESDQPFGNYGFEFIIPAREYIHTLFGAGLIPSPEADIWQIYVGGIEIEYDPEMYLLDPIYPLQFKKLNFSQDQLEKCKEGSCEHYKNDRRWYSPEAIEADRVKLLTKEEIERVQDQQQVIKICDYQERAGFFPEFGSQPLVIC